MAASCGFHYQKVTQKRRTEPKGYTTPVFCTSVQFSGDSNNHWCTHLSLSSSVLYMQIQQKSIRNTINCRCRRNRKRIAAFVKIAILFWRTGWDSTSAAAEARSRGKRATGTFSYTAPVRIPSKYFKRKSTPNGVLFLLADRVGFPACGRARARLGQPTGLSFTPSPLESHPLS